MYSYTFCISLWGKFQGYDASFEESLNVDEAGRLAVGICTAIQLYFLFCQFFFNPSTCIPCLKTMQSIAYSVLALTNSMLICRPGVKIWPWRVISGLNFKFARHYGHCAVAMDWNNANMEGCEFPS